MYNGIGLQTPRGSGTSGHVQRNWAFVRKKDKVNQKEDKSDQINRQPNAEILEHAKKRKIEVKCAELTDILEEQGLKEEEIEIKVDSYRRLLLKNDKKAAQILEEETDEIVSETHHIAAAQLEKNARLRSAFGISDQFVDGSSFDPERRAREAAAKAEAAKRYELVKTPSPPKEDPPPTDEKSEKKHKRKRSHSESKKSKKSKKHKKDKKHKSSK